MKAIYREFQNRYFVFAYQGHLTKKKTDKMAGLLLDNEWIRKHVPSEHLTLLRAVNTIKGFHRVKKLQIDNNNGSLDVILDDVALNFSGKGVNALHYVGVVG